MASVARLVVAGLSLLVLSTPAIAQGGGDATIVSTRGALLTTNDGAKWSSLASGTVPRNQPLVALGEVTLRSAREVAFRLVGEIGDVGPLPALEAAVHVHESKSADLELTLDRGILLLMNDKKQGAAKVVVRMFGEELHLTLREPGTKLGIDAYSRHAPGLAAIKADEPAHLLFFLCADGKVELATKEKTITLSALPPGPAMVRWDSVLRHAEIEHLDKLPEWVIKAKLAPDRLIKEAAAAKLAGGDPAAAAQKLVSAPEPIHRRVGVTALADRPAEVLAALTSVHRDVRQQAILVLRHWVGRQPGQIAKLEEALKQSGYNATQAESGVHLLLGFDDAERRSPATYQMLIDLLGHSKPAVRELAHWHLVRLAPSGKDVPFDAIVPAIGQAPVIEAWRRLIPPGRLPGSKP